MRPSHVTTLLLSITPLASAFPWPQWLPDIDTLVVRRQDGSSGDTPAAQATGTPESSGDNSGDNTTGDTTTGDTTTGDTTTGDTTTGDSTTGDSTTGDSTTGDSTTGDSTTGDSTTGDSTTGDSTTGDSTTGDSDATNLNTADASSATGDSSDNDTTNGNTTASGVGSAVVTFPATTLTSAYYRIGEYVTFKWNYTSLETSPTAVNVIASASTSALGASTWTLTQNMSFATDAAFTWDTGAFQTQALADQQPLLVEIYTLYIYDAEKAAVTETAALGELTGNAALTFGLYTGTPYTPLATAWTCATCSGALSTHERQAVGLLFAMFGMTVLSFTWFVTGLW